MLHARSLLLVLCAACVLLSCRETADPFECTDAIGCLEVAPEAPIKVGVLQVLSGDLELLGTRNLNSIELAADDREWELLGHTIALVVEDSRCSMEGGSTAASILAADPQIAGIIGPTCSGAAAGAMKVLSKSGFSMISGSSTAPSLTSVGGKPGPEWHPGFLRTAPNDALSGQTAATFSRQELGVSRAATINDGDPYTKGLTDMFEQVFTEMGGEIVLSTAVNKGDTDMIPVLTAVARSGAELMFFPVFQPEGDHLVLQAHEMQDLYGVTLMSAEGLYQDTFVEAVGEAGRGMYINTPATPQGPAYEVFASSYAARHAEEPAANYTAHTYDAANVLFNAIEAVAVRDERTEEKLYIGRQALRDALYATSKYHGLTGDITCDRYGDCGVARFQVTRLDDPAAGLAGLANNVLYTHPPEQ